MRIFPNVATGDYDLGSDPIEEKKIMVDLPDGGKAVIKHRTLFVHFKHRRTGDFITFRFTGRGNYYQRGTYTKKEEQVHESEVQETFKRLIGKDGEMAFRIAKVRLYME